MLWSHYSYHGSKNNALKLISIGNVLGTLSLKRFVANISTIHRIRSSYNSRSGSIGGSISSNSVSNSAASYDKTVNCNRNSYGSWNINGI